MKRRRWSVTKRDAQMDSDVNAWTTAQVRAPRGVAFVPAVIPRRPVRLVRPVRRPRRPTESALPFVPKRVTDDTSWVVESHTTTRIRVVSEQDDTSVNVETSDAGMDGPNGPNGPQPCVEPCVVDVDVDEPSVVFTPVNTSSRIDMDSGIVEDGRVPTTRRRNVVNGGNMTDMEAPIMPIMPMMPMMPMTLYTDAMVSAWFHVPARLEPVHKRAWTQVYQPRGLSEVIGNSYAKGQLVEWYKQVDKPCLLSGPVGVGKTCAAHALLKSAGYEVVDSNDPAIVEHTLMRKLIPGEPPIGLIIDEIDTTETHARTQLIKLVKAKLSQAQKTKTRLLPILFICENASDKSLTSLRGVCKVVRMVREPGSVKVLLDKLARAEGVPRTLCPAIEQVCNGDLRRATLLLEFTSKRGTRGQMSASSNSLFMNDLFFSSPFDAASLLLNGKDTVELGTLVDAVRSEGDIVPMLVHENYAQCEKSRDLSHVLHMAEVLADWDVMENHPSYQLGPTSSSMFVCETRTFAREATVAPCKSIAFTSYFPHLSTRRAAHDAMQTLNESFKTFHFDATDWRLLSEVARIKECGKWLLEELPDTCHAEFKKFVRSNRD